MAAPVRGGGDRGALTSGVRRRTVQHRGDGRELDGPLRPSVATAVPSTSSEWPYGSRGHRTSVACGFTARLAAEPRLPAQRTTPPTSSGSTVTALTLPSADEVSR